MVKSLVMHLKESVRRFGTVSSLSCSKDTGTTLECLPRRVNFYFEFSKKGVREVHIYGMVVRMAISKSTGHLDILGLGYLAVCPWNE